MGEVIRTLPQSISIQSVKMSPVQLNKLLDELEESVVVPAKNRRRHKRVSCHCAGVLIVVNQGGFESTFYIPVRDISTSGIAFLHRSMLHTGTECSIRVRMPDHRWAQIDGTIVRSRYLRDMVYEIGVKFHDEIDLTQFGVSQEACGAEPA